MSQRCIVRVWVIVKLPPPTSHKPHPFQGQPPSPFSSIFMLFPGSTKVNKMSIRIMETPAAFSECLSCQLNTFYAVIVDASMTASRDANSAEADVSLANGMHFMRVLSPAPSHHSAAVSVANIDSERCIWA